MTEPRTLLMDYAESLRMVHPKRKLLLLGLIRRANKHYGLELRAGEDVRFAFKVYPVELQDLLEVSHEIVKTHLDCLEGKYIETSMYMTSAVDWHYKVSLTPLLRLAREGDTHGV